MWAAATCTLAVHVYICTHARVAEELRQVLPRNCGSCDNPLLLDLVSLSSLTHMHVPSHVDLPHTHTHTRVYQQQGLRCPVVLNLHEAGIMASPVALSVSNVPRCCSRLVPISQLLACWSPPPPPPARSAARARKDRDPHPPSSSIHAVLLDF